MCFVAADKKYNFQYKKYKQGTGLKKNQIFHTNLVVWGYRLVNVFVAVAHQIISLVHKFSIKHPNCLITSM